MSPRLRASNSPLRRRRALPLVSLLAVACIQSTNGEGPAGTPVPGGKARVLAETQGHGHAVLNGDRVTVDLVGRYASGEVWARGPLTFVVGPGSYPGAENPLSIGSTIRMQYLTTPNDTTTRT